METAQIELSSQAIDAIQPDLAPLEGLISNELITMKVSYAGYYTQMKLKAMVGVYN